MFTGMWKYGIIFLTNQTNKDLKMTNQEETYNCKVCSKKLIANVDYCSHSCYKSRELTKVEKLEIEKKSLTDSYAIKMMNKRIALAKKGNK